MDAADDCAMLGHPNVEGDRCPCRLVAYTPRTVKPATWLTLKDMMRRVGLVVLDADRNPVHARVLHAMASRLR